MTAHTLLELREHLKRRGIDIVINFKVKAEEFMSHTVTVCEICYAVSIAEYHLMMVEREFAKAQNIPIKNNGVKIDISGNNNEMNSITQPVMSNTQLYQWRVLFYFDFLVNGKDRKYVTFCRKI